MQPRAARSAIWEGAADSHDAAGCSMPREPPLQGCARGVDATAIVYVRMHAAVNSVIICSLQCDAHASLHRMRSSLRRAEHAHMTLGLPPSMWRQRTTGRPLTARLCSWYNAGVTALAAARSAASSNDSSDSSGGAWAGCHGRQHQYCQHQMLHIHSSHPACQRSDSRLNRVQMARIARDPFDHDHDRRPACVIFMLWAGAEQLHDGPTIHSV